MNIVLLDGGLGNQLFQISFALFLSEMCECPTQVNFKTFQKRLQHGADGLEDVVRYFKLPIHTGESTLFRSLSQLALTRRSLGTRKVFSPIRTLNGSVGFQDIRVFSGYWQNFIELHPYYLKVAQACRDVFSLKPVDQSIIHARFGDYKKGKNQEIYFQLDKYYYFDALSKLKDDVGLLDFKVITDDVERAQKMFLSTMFNQFKFRFERGNMVSDFADLAQSSTLVATNSTFCWWGALASAENNGLKRLIAPKDWFQAPYRHRTSPSYEFIRRTSEETVCTII